jgi:hypothetical protein
MDTFRSNVIAYFHPAFSAETMSVPQSRDFRSYQTTFHQGSALHLSQRAYHS